ncbi:MAG: PIN domain-containing protein [Bauldia sp.]
MATAAVVDSGFLVALLSTRDSHNAWAVDQAGRFVTPWHTCEAVLSETFHVLPQYAAPTLAGLLERQAVLVSFDLTLNLEAVLAFMRKYADLPIDLADACLVRMTEVLADPIVLTTDMHFRSYRRHSRLVVPCVMPHH